MEEILAGKGKKDNRTPKIVLKDQEKRGIECQKIMQELVDKAELGELTEELKKRVDFWEIASHKPTETDNRKIRKPITYIEIDEDLDKPFADMFYKFMKFMDRKTLPCLKTIKLMNLSIPRCRLTETSINNEQVLPKGSEISLTKPKPVESNANGNEVFVSSESSDLIISKDFVIYFKIYQPSELHIVGERNPQKPKPNQGIILSNKNTLADLRDGIRCGNDYCRSVHPPHEMYKEITPSGMFYINNTFYVDKRDPRYKDYSEFVKTWCSSKGLYLGETFKMESTLMSDLTLMLNYPYLYQHLGYCEHLVVVKKIRFVHELDSKHPSDYPKLYMIGITTDVKCELCKKQTMQCTVTGSKRASNDPCHCCIKCFEQFFLVNQEPVEENAVCSPFVNRSELINFYF